MMALLAIVIAGLAVTGCGLLVRRQPAFAMYWAGTGLALLGIGGAALLIEHRAASPAGALVTAAALILLSGMALLPVLACRGRTCSGYEVLDIIAVIFTTGFASWEMLLEPGWASSGWEGQVLLAALALSVAGTLISLVLATSLEPCPLALVGTATAAILWVPIATETSVLETKGAEAALSSGSLLVGLAAGAATIWATSWVPARSSGEWSIAQRFRNTLAVYVASALVVIFVVVSAHGDTLSDRAALFLMIGTAALFFRRFRQAYRQIVELQQSVTTRNAIIRMPLQAGAIKNRADLDEMLTQIARVAAETVGLSRAELLLHPTQDAGPIPQRATWGLTEIETDFLGEVSLVQAAGVSAHRPRVLHQHDPTLPIAVQRAWAMAAKNETLIVPLVAGDRLVGHVEAWSPASAIDASAADLALAADVGREAGLLIEHAELMLSSRSEIIEAEMLLAVSEIVARSQTVAECLPEVAERLLRRAEAERITISIIDEDAGDVYIAADARSLSPFRASLQGSHWPASDWASYAELREASHSLAFARSGPETPARILEIMELHGAESYLAIPGYTDGRMTSIVQIMSSTPVLYESGEVSGIWHSIARQIQLGITSLRALEKSRQRELLESMRRQINESLQSTATLPDMYAAIADHFRSIDDLDGASILSVDQATREYIVEAEWSKDPVPHRSPGTRIGQNDLIILEGITEETQSRVRWIGQPGMSERLRIRMAEHHIGSAIAMPLRIEDRLVGVLLLYSVKERPFRPEIVELGEQLAGTIAIVIKSIDLRASEAGQREEQLVKLRMLEAATSQSDPIAALQAVADAGLGYGGAESINIAFIDEGKHQMVMAADSTIPEWPGVEEPGTILPIGPDSAQERALLTLLPQHYSSTQPGLSEADLSDIAEYDAHSWICAPLRVGGEAVGFLQVLSRMPDAFDARRVRLWDEVAQQVALVISTLRVSFDNQRLSRQQQTLARINAASSSTSSVADTYRTIAEAALSLDGVDSSAVFIWHDEDNLLEVACHLAADPEASVYPPGWRDVPLAWLENDVPIRPRPPVHFWMDDETLAPSQQAYLRRSGSGCAALFMLVEEGQVHGVLSLKSRKSGPLPPETIQLADVIAATSAAIVRNLRSRSAERRVEEEQRALLRLSRAATTSTSEQELLDVIALTVRDLCEARSAEVYVIDPDAGGARLAAICSEETIGGAPAGGQRVTGDAWLGVTNSPAALEPIVIHSPDDPRVSDDLRSDLLARGISSVACMPLAVGEKLRGYVVVVSDQPRRFTSAIVRSTATIANQGALALEHTAQRLEETRVAEQRALLLRVSKAAGSSLHLEEVLSEIAEASLGVANSESCAIELYDPESGELVLAGIARVNDWVIQETLIGKRRQLGSWGFDEHIVNEGTVIISSIDDPRINQVMYEDLVRFNTQSIVAHRLTSGGALIGAYYCFARQPNAYSDGDRWITGEIAAHVVSAIQNARMLEHEHIMAQEREQLLRITEAATRSLNLSDVLQEIADATLGLAGAESCHVELVDHDDQVFITSAYAAVADWTDLEDAEIGKRCPIGAWPIDYESVSVREPISIGSIEDPRVTGNMRDDMIAFGTQSLLLIPIWTDDVCVGILNIYSRRRNAFSHAQQTLAYTLATHAANAIQNARTHQRERDRRRHQESLLQITSAATSSLDLNVSMHAVCEAACIVADAESAVVGIFHPHLDAFEIVADVTVSDWDFAEIPGSVYPISEYPAYERVLSGSGSFRVDAETTDPETRRYFERNPVGMATYALVPFWLNDVCLGYLGLFDRRQGRFDQPVLDLLDAASPLVGLALSNGLQWRHEQRRAADRAVVVAVGRIAVSDSDISRKLALIAEMCLQLQGVSGVNIFQWNADDGVLESLVDTGNEDWMANGHSCERFALPENHALWSAVVESAEATRYSLNDPGLVPAVRDLIIDCAAESLAIFPLRAEERTKGAIVMYSRDRYQFDDELVRVGQEIATQTALSMRASWLLETTQRYARQQSALLSVNNAVMSATQSSLGEVLSKISTETMRLMGADCCEIESLLPNQTETELLAQVLATDWGSAESNVGQRYALMDWPVTRHVLDTQETVTLHKASAPVTDHEHDLLFGYGTETALISPMVIDGRSVGVITFYSRTPAAFAEEERVLAREFGSLAALAIDRARTHMALSEQASYDGLTGLLNRRALLERIDHHIALSDRSEDPVSLLMIDMNDFKQVNDLFGHLAGDLVLRETADFLKRTLRASDLVGRYGGDEFIAVLPGTDVVHAIALSERLLKSVQEVRITLANGAVVVPSVAIGFAAYPSQATDAQTLIDAADRAMYEYKNRINAGMADEPAAVLDDQSVRLIG